MQARMTVVATFLATSFAILATLSTARSDDWSDCQSPDADAAIAGCTRYLARPGRSASQRAVALTVRGDAWRRKNDFERALTDQTEAIRLNPKEPHLYSNRGVTLRSKGDHDLALADYAEAIKRSPKNAWFYNNRGITYREKNDLALALIDLEDAVRLDGKQTTFLLNRATILREMGDLDRSLEDLNRAIKLDPKNPALLSARGFVYRAKGDLDRAIADSDAAIRIAPRFAVPYVNRGLSYESHGDLARAQSDFRLAVALPPDFHIKKSGEFNAIVDGRREQQMARVRLALLSNPDDTRPSTPAAPAGRATPGRRIAIVIGNGAYAHVPVLPNPINDARAITKHLRTLGFEVTEGTNLDKRGMKRMSDGFLRDAATARVALMFYAGHGVQIDGRNYLVPVDASFTAGGEITGDMVEVDTMMTGLDDQIRTNIVVLDACRDNPMAQKTAANTAGATRSLAIRSGLAATSGLGKGATLGAGTLLVFATAPGQVALDGEGDNSPFSAALSRHIGTPGLEVQQMLTRVRAEVVAATSSKQVPWSNSSLLGDVYLASRRP
jgi:tetratricopeptide (TPR) repeat protein